MPRVKVNELLKHATENRYGVAAVNTLNVETVKYVAPWGPESSPERSVPCRAHM